MKTETRKEETMEILTTTRIAYVGKYALRDKLTRSLLWGGGSVAPGALLYDTADAAGEAARATTWCTCEVVKLVAAS